jgi:pimeloyl-ACP methyl ester carboxylesterase
LASAAVLALVVAALTPLRAAAIEAPRVEPCDVTVTEIGIRSSAGHTLAGALALPRGHVPLRAIVVYLSGAGPQTREYATVSPADSSLYVVLQQRLLCRGVGSFVFDEVGTGRSGGDYRAYATTRNLARDAGDVVVRLRSMPDLQGAKVMLVGHSEGGLIAAMIAASTPVDGVVTLGAPAYDGESIIAYQRITHRGIYGIPFAAFDARHQERRQSDRWYQEFLGFDPAPEYARVRVPTLILHGELDIDVSAPQADSLLAAMHRGNPKVRCIRLGHTDHTFTDMEHIAWRPDTATVRHIVTFVDAIADGDTSAGARTGRVGGCVVAASP